MVHLPGEHRVSLEGQCREKLYDLIVMDNLYDINFGRSFIEYLSNVDHADETSRRNFQKYLSAYSYTKPFANYLSRCVGYLSFKKYITQYIKINIFIFLAFIVVDNFYIYRCIRKRFRVIFKDIYINIFVVIAHYVFYSFNSSYPSDS